MTNHKLIDTGEYLVSEVDGLPTCLYSYEFYDKMISHPKVKEAYESKEELYVKDDKREC